MKVEPGKVRLSYEFDEPGSGYSEYAAMWHERETGRYLTVCIMTDSRGEGLFWPDYGGAVHQSLGTCQFSVPSSDKVLKRWLRNAWLRRYADGDASGFARRDLPGGPVAYVTSRRCVEDRED